ncbi:hypothetical protein [Halobacillus shinanisalinarum]|nr:hypothetical protein [Halobacillus shinanisalinarum]
MSSQERQSNASCQQIQQLKIVAIPNSYAVPPFSRWRKGIAF